MGRVDKGRLVLDCRHLEKSFVETSQERTNGKNGCKHCIDMTKEDTLLLKMLAFCGLEKLVRNNGAPVVVNLGQGLSMYLLNRFAVVFRDL